MNPDFRALPEFDDHEMLIALTDEKSGLKSFVGIHNTNRGLALGGTRLRVYQTEEEALRDALNLSKAMTYKCALANLPYGGGKAVIIAKQDDFNHDEVLKAYARSIEKLGGLFKTGTDVGISDDDVRLMATQTKYMLGVTEADRGNLSTASCAALGVFHSIEAAMVSLFGSSSLQGKRIAIKGVGKLGGELARLCSEAGASIVASDVDDSKCEALRQKLSDVEIVSNDEINSVECDVYSPCALGKEFTEQNIDDLKCRAVVGGANNQLDNEQVGQLLHERGIIYAPDYVANAGGLIYVADELEPGGFRKERVIERTEAIRQTMETIFERSKATRRPTSDIANELARERIFGQD